MACSGQNDLKMFSKAGVGRWHSLRADASTEAVNLSSSSLMSEMRRCRMAVSQLLYLVFLDLRNPAFVHLLLCLLVIIITEQRKM